MSDPEQNTGKVVACVDVGCARYGGDYSIERLVEEFNPAFVWGYDPAHTYPEESFKIGDADVWVSKAAAWTYSGEIGFSVNGLGGGISEAGPRVACVDLSGEIEAVKQHADEVILKIDAEGAEYELLEHLIFTGVDTMLKLAWVEWHPKTGRGLEARRASIGKALGCELHEWRW